MVLVTSQLSRMNSKWRLEQEFCQNCVGEMLYMGISVKYIARKLYVGKTFEGKIRKIYRNTSGLDYLTRKGTASGKVDSLCITFNSL